MRKTMKKIVSVILTVCLLAVCIPVCLPQLPTAGAAETDPLAELYAWVLDTDGVEAGEEYLIVNGTAANSTALKRNGNIVAAQAVVVKDGNTIDSFDGDTDCSFVFSKDTSGTSATTMTVARGDRYLNISSGSISYNTSDQDVSVRRYTAGYYRIYYYTNWSNRYVRYYNGSWSANTSNNTYSNLYLYKKTYLPDPTHTVHYDGNGYTEGTLPGDKGDLYTGDTYTVAAPIAELKKVVGEDTYLFHCWNTTPDGTGVDYMPGATITMGNADITLYAKWYLQPKYTITVRCNVDGQPHDIPHNHEGDVYVSRDGVTYLPLTKTETGVYVTTVTENGDYLVYFGHDGEYESAHGHQVVIYNQDGETILQNFTVTYEKGYDGEVIAGNTDTWQEIYHAYTTVFATDVIPVRAGYAFRGWVDGEGNPVAGGTMLTASHSAPIRLIATWEKLTDVQVEITLNHNAPNGGFNNTTDKHTVQLQLVQLVNGVYLPVGDPVTLNDASHYDEESNVTTYSYTFKDLPAGDYSVSSVKTGYAENVTVDENGVIHIVHTYAPDNFDLYFTVETIKGTPAELRPTAVNIRVLYWGYNEDGTLGWNIITQHDDGNPPVTVTLDANGNGTGFYPVWKDWADYNHPYIYRLMVSSFVMPDGTVVMADSNDYILYTPNGSGLYTATMVVTDGNTLPDGIVPAPELDGAYYDGTQQQGALKVVLDVHPMTVTFDAVEGDLNGESLITLTNQFAYPDLNRYLPTREGKIFDGWYLDAAYTIPADNRYGSYLTGDVTYYAKWRDPLTLSGTVTVEGTYMQDGEKVSIHEQDRAKEAVVVLLKETAGAFNVVGFQTVKFPSNYGDLGEATYEFSIADENANYRIEVLELNYNSTYDNNGDDAFTTTENIVVAQDGFAVVDVHLDFVPQSYTQTVVVDASQIGVGYRPTDALVEYYYRDLGDNGDWTIISQHTASPYGLPVTLAESGLGADGYEVWNWHTDGVLYEYQVKLSKVYGNIEGVYDQTGIYYSADMPYTVRYGSTAWYSNTLGQQSGELTATLIPKQYEIIFDLGFESDSIVSGMEHLIAAGPDGDYYAHRHTWSHSESFLAYPYRPGYIFRGWDIGTAEGVVIKNNGEITIAAGMSETVTIKAMWEMIEDTAYVVRYLEKNTNKVLQGSRLSYAEPGTPVVAVDEVVTIKGYIFDSASTPRFTVSEDNDKNVLTLYYLPDGSDGYTEQVEGNLHLDKTAILEDNGTYTVWMETFTTDNPVTTLIQQNTPLDIVLVIDQSGSISQNGYLETLRSAVENFVDMIAAHGNRFAVDHRIAIVGYAGDVDCGTTSTDLNEYPLAGGTINGGWLNTGVFDSNGDFHNYPIKGFNYSQYNGSIEKDGTYYTKSGNDYLLLMYHEEFYLAMDENRAKTELLNGKQIYGYVDGNFVPLTRNSSGLWLYGDKMLYSDPDFYTYHQDVWTHRNGLDNRVIHAYGTGDNYTPTDGHEGVYTREEVTSGTPELDVYKDALIPVSTNKNGAGGVNPSLEGAANRLGSNSGTYVNYGIEMANRVFAANPLGDNEEGRIRVMLTFTDGVPGETSFDTTIANNALAEAYKTKNDYGAFSYAVGLYTKSAISINSNEAAFLNALSSNYPNAKKMTDVYSSPSYSTARNTNINNGTQYYVRTGSYNNYTYLPLQYGTYTYNGTTRTGWYYKNGNTYTLLTTTQNATTNNSGKVSNTTLYYVSSGGYAATEHSGYYSTAENEEALKEYFDSLVREITTKIQVDIVLHQDTILRDIMGQGLVLTDGTVITAYRVAGSYNQTTGGIEWARNENGDYRLEYVASLDMSGGKTASDQTTLVTKADGTQQNVPYIQVYNYGSANPTNPAGANYHPHTVDVTGYDFSNWYIDEDHPDGYMMVVQISRIEAMDDVEWGRSTYTNHQQSGLWLPANEKGQRELLLPFEQPTTIFVERAYVLDYAKPFTLEGWYFDDEDGKEADPLHIDAAIANGMNWFDPQNPNLTNQVGSYYGNTKYGNVALKDGAVTYTPTTTNWDGADEFYVFGDTWRKTVLAQDANQNGNLWTKVQVIPANSVYYEDSFLTTEGEGGLNGFDGFTFTGSWTTVFDGTAADNNGEKPEHQEQPPYGDVHGWIDDLVSEGRFSDGSAHFTDTIGAAAEFTFTGTGVDVYTRTNKKSGVVVATLSRTNYYDKDGNYVDEWTFWDGKIMDNLAMSGDYYQIPTISFMNLPHGNYKVELIATASTTSNKDDQGNWIGDEPVRTEYHIDGIRIYKPLPAEAEEDETIRDAYEQEVNASFTEVRDILLDYGDFNVDMEDSADGTAGAVFIDWIREWQGSGNDQPGVGVPTYEIGTFNKYGPKNEVYLTSGQAIVLKVDPNNTYFVGLKSLDGTPTIANVSGITTADPVAIRLSHSTDLYYRVTPIDGYIVIQNGATDHSVLSVTKIRATNLNGAVKNGGILPVQKEEAIAVMTAFSRHLMQNDSDDEAAVGDVTPIDPMVESFRQFLRALFGSVRAWLKD